MDFQSLYTAGRTSEVIGKAGVRQDIFTGRFGLLGPLKERSAPFAATRRRARPSRPSRLGSTPASARSAAKACPSNTRSRLPAGAVDGAQVRPAAQGHGLLLTSYNQDAAMTRMQGWATGWAGTLDKLFPALSPASSTRSSRRARRSTSPRFPCPSLRALLGRARGRDPPDSAPLLPGTGEAGSPTGGHGRVAGVQDGPDLGNNNWAVSGRLTRDGFPILQRHAPRALASGGLVRSPAHRARDQRPGRGFPARAARRSRL